MTVLTAEQVAAAAYIGGFRNSEIVEAVATAFGESSFNTESRNFCCYGLWQINKSAHEKLFASGKWDNPADNGRMAYQIYREAGGSWGPWQAHGNSRYKLALPRARTALQQLTADLQNGKTAEQILGSQSTNGITVAPTGATTDTLKGIVDPHTWLRAGIILIGTMLLIIGLIWMLMGSKSGKKIAKNAINYFPEGKVLKAGKTAKSASVSSKNNATQEIAS